MTVSRDLWTCPECGQSERLPDPLPERDAARHAAQLRHGAQHRREGREAVRLHDALTAALDGLAAGLVARVLVHPRDVQRLRSEVTRRGARVAVCESLAVAPGHGLPLSPVAGLDRRAAPR